MELITIRHDASKLKRVAKIMRTISHPSRLSIVELLIEEGRLSVKEIYESIGISQSNASQHLKALEDVEILSSIREGKNIFYQIENQHVLNLLNCVNECAGC
jgi:ArsR family transcriptional regulator